MTAEVLKTLLAANIAAGGAIVVMLLAGPVIRKAFGARLAYAAWLIVPLAVGAALLPARSADLPIAGAPVRTMAEATVSVVEAAPRFDWSSLALAAWAMGAIALIAVTAWAQTRTLALIGRLTPEDGVVRAQSRAIGPATLGVLKPRIMVPADFEQRFDADERAVIMAHEQTHIAQGDVRINALIELARCLFWFNPLIHIAARRIRIDQELACDAAVIARFPKARRTYAEALLKTQTASAPLPLGCYWPERSHKHLKERLTMLTYKSPGRARSLAGAACLAALGLGTGYAAWAAAPEAAAPIALPAPATEIIAPLPVAEPAPAPAPQQLSNSQAPAEATASAPAEEDAVDILVTVPRPEPVDGQSYSVRRLVRVPLAGAGDWAAPLPEGFDPATAGGPDAVRIMCQKTADGPLGCTRNGEPLDAAEVERLRAMMPPTPVGAEGKTQTFTIFSSRRHAE